MSFHSCAIRATNESHLRYHKLMTNIQDNRRDDAVNVAPQFHQVLYEDDKMRILKVTVPVGQVADMHWHPHNANYVLKSGKLKFTDPQDNSKEVELAEGMITASDKDVFHKVENTGDTNVETIQVKLKY